MAKVPVKEILGWMVPYMLSRLICDNWLDGLFLKVWVHWVCWSAFGVLSVALVVAVRYGRTPRLLWVIRGFLFFFGLVYLLMAFRLLPFLAAYCGTWNPIFLRGR